MKFKALQENLRKTIWQRIEHKNLTGLRLARQTGFKQAHISNFLNRKRNLSLEGMDKLLSVQRLSVLDLLDPAEINKRASVLPPSEDAFENVALVDGTVAASQALLMNMDIKDILKFKKSFLRRLRPELEGAARSRWERFAVLKVDGRDGMSMFPRLLPGATVLIDRHYNSLKSYHRNEQNMYAVRKGDGCTVKYVEQVGTRLILRPQNPAYPVDLVEVEEGKTFADYIVGRVCHVAIET